MGLSANLRAFLKPTIAAFYPIPKIALFPLIMLLFGIGETSKWVIVAIAVFFQVLFSTLAGVVNIDRIYLDVSENFGATRLQAYRTVALPGALPFIFTGLHLGLGMALIVVVIAENFGTKAGLGFMVWRSWQVFEIRDMYVAARDDRAARLLFAACDDGDRANLPAVESRGLRPVKCIRQSNIREK